MSDRPMAQALGTTCATCRFHSKEGHYSAQTVGECRRHAPILADRSWVNPNCPELGRNAEFVAEFPVTPDTGWCGDWQRLYRVVKA